MPRSLKRTDDVDVFDYGKAVTLILSQTKELNKTRNALVDDINYLEARKKQEVGDLEKILVEKADVLKLKGELTQKILASKSDFMADVSKRKEELAVKEADLIAREDALAEDNKRLMQDVTDRQNELARRGEENKKQWDASMDALNKRETVLIERETVVATEKATLEAMNGVIEADRLKVGEQEQLVTGQLEHAKNKVLQLDNREAALADKENKIEEQRQRLAALAADLEGQASLIESEKHKNKTDADTIRVMQKNLYDKKAELDNREIHIKDRESIAASR